MTAPDPTAGEHHPNCYQNTGVPDDMPSGICDCRVLRMLDAASPPAVADPTAGERACTCGQFAGTSVVYADCPVHCDRYASPPAVAAPTGTSEDVEALAEVLYAAACRQGPTVAAWDFARAVLASDWLAAQLAAAEQRGRDKAGGVK